MKPEVVVTCFVCHKGGQLFCCHQVYFLLQMKYIVEIFLYAIEISYLEKIQSSM